MTINTLGFLGAGNMAGAIIKGLLASGFEPSRLWVYDRNDDKCAYYADLAINVATDANSLAQACDAIVLAVKPQALKQTCLDLSNAAQQSKPLIISVAAAIPAQSITTWLGGNLATIRVMPNTPSVVQAGATGMYANNLCSAEQRAFTDSVFTAVGTTTWVEDEALIHSVTAAAGSAPAYFYRFAEAMSKTAKTQGLSDSQARALIGQTMLGAAKMILETDQDIGQMRKDVCSPKGTTERAIFSFENDNIDDVVNNAMKACFDRSIELTDLLSK